jgi:hypothetical protein
VEVAAFIVSIVSLGVAVATAYFAFRQAAAAKVQAVAADLGTQIANRAARTDEKRLGDEREPTISAAIFFVGDSGHRLELQLHSARPIMILEARFINSVGVDYIEGDASGRIDRASFGKLTPGIPQSKWVSVREGSSQNPKIRIECRGEGTDERWTIPLVVPVFPELDEYRPEFRTEIVFKSPTHFLQTELMSLRAVRFVEIEILRASGLLFANAIDAAGKTARKEQIAPGEEVVWELDIDQNHSKDARLAIKATGPRGERWTSEEDIQLPQVLAPSVFDFAATIKYVDSGPPRLIVTSLYRWPLPSIDVEIVSHDGVWFADSSGVPASNAVRARKARKHSATLPGGQATWRVTFGDLPPTFFWLNITIPGFEPVSQFTVHVPPTVRDRARRRGWR